MGAGNPEHSGVAPALGPAPAWHSVLAGLGSCGPCKGCFGLLSMGEPGWVLFCGSSGDFLGQQAPSLGVLRGRPPLGLVGTGAGDPGLCAQLPPGSFWPWLSHQRFSHLIWESQLSTRAPELYLTQSPFPSRHPQPPHSLAASPPLEPGAGVIQTAAPRQTLCRAGRQKNQSRISEV